MPAPGPWASTRTSPTRRVIPRASIFSSMATAILRLVPSKSRASAAEIVPRAWR